MKYAPPPPKPYVERPPTVEELLLSAVRDKRINDQDHEFRMAALRLGTLLVITLLLAFG